jgi:hypothetical protein
MGKKFADVMAFAVVELVVGVVCRVWLCFVP